MRPAAALSLSALTAVALAASVFTGCQAAQAAPPARPSSFPSPLERVAAIHGGAGPWAVLGYRMGVYALAKLSLPPGSFDLDVKHESPRTPQYACVADGAQAATGASLGKVNLSLVEADEAHIQTTYRKKSTGQSLTLRPVQAFRDRFLEVPRQRLGEAGNTVLNLPDGELFEEVR